MPIASPLATVAEASLVEVYSAIQGEGPLVGERQIFLRTHGCHVRCAYCDTPDTHVPGLPCRAETAAGSREFETIANPVALDRVIEFVARLHRPRSLHRWIALTGGEPLQQVTFLEAALPEIRALGLQVYLETDGLLPRALARVREYVDFVSMDLKIPSSTGEAARYAAHREFLETWRGTDGYVKIVVAVDTSLEELHDALDASRVPSHTLIVLQPVTPYGPVTSAPAPERMLDIQARLKVDYAHVRVIPQVHRLMGQI
ncbi:MAG: 7-carboxy-7-deazaguanine synthase QueE [Planctomycetes bacterium]|nr:7-carboxy-7-deazaguanine synthase QueE [Planctomycetota bacterium]MBI3847576.1 7-carboxy-7-deazaguanine synthase QueE [Planctomycetota bacterium]